jgi:Spy/CpxP family protein refolding chaperone
MPDGHMSEPIHVNRNASGDEQVLFLIISRVRLLYKGCEMDMNWKFFRSIVAVLAMLLLVSGSSFAQDEITDQLGLSTRQKEQLKELREQTKRESKPVVEEINRLLNEERRLRKSGAPEGELRRVMKLRADKEIELTLAISRFNEKLEALLTADQRQKLGEIIAKRNGSKTH